MNKMAKGLLVGAILFLLSGGAINLGWINPGNLDALYVVLPTGAVLFGLFLIVLLLQREADSHAEDHHLPEPESKDPLPHAPPANKTPVQQH
jgi:hypothetical protein